MTSHVQNHGTVVSWSRGPDLCKNCWKDDVIEILKKKTNSLFFGSFMSLDESFKLFFSNVNSKLD